MHNLSLNRLSFTYVSEDKGDIGKNDPKQDKQLAKLLDMALSTLSSEQQKHIREVKIDFTTKQINVFWDHDYAMAQHSKGEQTHLPSGFQQIKKINRIPYVLTLHCDKIGNDIREAIEQLGIPTLYLYSSGGGGHKSAKDAKMESNLQLVLDRVKAQNPGSEDNRLKINDFMQYCKKTHLVHEDDVLHDYLGRIGKWSSKQWDDAQKAGDVHKQESLASKQWLSDIVFGPVVFHNTLQSLIANKPKIVVSTQAMATPSILLAIKIYNMFLKPTNVADVKLHLYMTDMPTESAGHFFRSLRGLHSGLGKEYLVLHAPEVRDDHWEVWCGMKKEQVIELKTDELPVRPAFIAAVRKYQPPSTPQVKIKVSAGAEQDLLNDALMHQGMPAMSTATVEKIYQMGEKDKGCFLMLGSQPTKESIKSYVKQFIQIARNDQNKYVIHHLFAFAGKFEAAKMEDGKEVQCFYQELCEYIKSEADWPLNLRVVPLSFQDPEQLVTLALQCDTITRSGGATIMEMLVLDAACQQHNLPERRRDVHAESVTTDSNTEELKIPLWEKGNFDFMQKAIGADKVRTVSPTTYSESVTTHP